MRHPDNFENEDDKLRNLIETFPALYNIEKQIRDEHPREDIRRALNNAIFAFEYVLVAVEDSKAKDMMVWYRDTFKKYVNSPAFDELEQEDMTQLFGLLYSEGVIL